MCDALSAMLRDYWDKCSSLQGTRELEAICILLSSAKGPEEMNVLAELKKITQKARKLE